MQWASRRRRDAHRVNRFQARLRGIGKNCTKTAWAFSEAWWGSPSQLALVVSMLDADEGLSVRHFSVTWTSLFPLTGLEIASGVLLCGVKAGCETLSSRSMEGLDVISGHSQGVACVRGAKGCTRLPFVRCGAGCDNT
eukprot:scaffold28288_cov127-Isochrysis_galbana.AAC.3